MLPGLDYGEALIDAINASGIMLLVLSARSNTSPQVRREVERAASKDIPILPLRIEDVTLSKGMEYFISAGHWLDATQGPLEAHLEALVAAVQRLLARKSRLLPSLEGVQTFDIPSQMLPTVQAINSSGKDVLSIRRHGNPGFLVRAESDPDVRGIRLHWRTFRRCQPTRRSCSPGAGR